MMTTPALGGLRVLDLGIVTAGAATSQVFADFGADVIKVESHTYLDPFRNWSQIAGGGSDDPNASPPFESVNRGKRGIAVDLKTEAGRTLFLQLARTADIVVENFRRGVLARLGIDFEQLRAVNPRILLLSLSSQGLDGPESGYISFGSSLEALGGLMAITGYGGDDSPLWTGNNVNYPDQLVSFLAPGFALAALRARATTNSAILVDAPQREAVTSAVGETVLSYSQTGITPTPIGNRDSRRAPQGVYRTRGDDCWIAISVGTDEQFTALARNLGLDDLFADPVLAHADGRQDAHDRIDRAIEAAVADRDASELAESLQLAGVPASAVLHAVDVLGHPQLAALGFAVSVPGDPIVQRGFLARFGQTPGQVSRRAPRLGEHTSEILRAELGCSDDAIRALHESGAIFCDELSDARVSETV